MRAGGVAILFGAAIGVLIALARNGGESSSDVAPTTSAQRTASPSSAAASAPALTPSPSEPTTLATVTPPETAASATPPETSPSPSVTETSLGPLPALAEAAASATAGPADSALPFATPLPPVTSKSELDRAEIRCYEVDPEECGRAADAYDTGQLVPRDVARATRLRKVELTRLVRRCEERSAHACLVLAGRYEAGEGVDENDRHARALVEHARELCRRHPTAECVNGEPK